MEYYLIQVRTQTRSLFGMHFYGMGGVLYVRKVGCNHTIEVHSKFGHRLINLVEMMFYRRMLSKTLLRALRAHVLMRSWFGVCLDVDIVSYAACACIGIGTT